MRFFAMGLLGLAACASAIAPPDRDEGGKTVRGSLRVEVKGAPDRALRKTLLQITDTWRYRKSPPANLEMLLRQARQDVALQQVALRSCGYYEAEVHPEVEVEDSRGSVVFHVRAGPPFLLCAVAVAPAGGAWPGALSAPSASVLGLKLGRPALARAIVDSQAALIRRIQDQGYPFGAVSSRVVTVDFSQRCVSVDYVVDPGSPARFGAVTLDGLRRVKPAFVRRRIPWKEGDSYNATQVQKARSDLLDTGLFSLTVITNNASLSPSGLLPIHIRMTERRRRTIAFGAGYSTDNGVGGQGIWQNRNLFGGAEMLRLFGEISEVTLNGEILFEKPDFFVKDQSLVFDSKLSDDKPSVYTSKRLRNSVELRRKLGRNNTLGGGAALTLDRVSQLGVEREYALVSVPMQFNRDTRDDVFDPNQGGQAGLSLEPFFDATTNGVDFLKTILTVAHVLHLGNNPFVTLAGRWRGGSITGAEDSEVPADARFYAGGGGSIRGYAYQEVGPMVSNQVVGGNALLEMSLEARWKINASLGLVGFLDGGSAFSADFPDKGERLLWGAGIGLRYFTMVGPVRLDVGFPLNRRDDLDKPFQVYVSIGQAF